jgi:hypothetical protein
MMVLQISKWRFTMKWILKPLLLILLVGSSGYSQNNASISGFIYDDASGKALIGVNIYLRA